MKSFREFLEDTINEARGPGRPGFGSWRDKWDAETPWKKGRGAPKRRIHQTKLDDLTLKAAKLKDDDSADSWSKKAADYKLRQAKHLAAAERGAGKQSSGAGSHFRAAILAGHMKRQAMKKALS